MGKDEDTISEKLLRLGAGKRARMAADSRLSFRRYSFKVSLMLFFMLLDGLLIPSAFQLFGLLTVQFAVPIGATLIAAAAVQLWALSRIR